MSEQSENAGKVRSLTDAIRRVRTAEAERSDVVVELRDAERARLELLADELRSVFAEVPADDETFLFSVAGGLPPRLWIDMTSFVAMGRDRRTYRFVKDTRLGRTVILESAALDEMADCVTSYIAERIIERQRAIEGDWVAKRPARAEPPSRKDVREAIAAAGTEGGASTAGAGAAAPDRRVLGWVVAAFLFGVLIGVAGLLGYAWVRIPAA